MVFNVHLYGNLILHRGSVFPNATDPGSNILCRAASPPPSPKGSVIQNAAKRNEGSPQ